MTKQLTPLEALWKIDHTICMNFNDKNIKWNIDNKDDQVLYKNGDGYDPIDTDCKSFEEFCDCYDIIETALKRLDELDTWINQSDTTKIKALNKKLKALEVIKKELNLEVKEDNGLYRLITYQTDNHLIRKDQFDLLKEILK